MRDCALAFAALSIVCFGVTTTALAQRAMSQPLPRPAAVKHAPPEAAAPPHAPSATSPPKAG